MEYFVTTCYLNWPVVLCFFLSSVVVLYSSVILIHKCAYLNYRPSHDYLFQGRTRIST